MNRHITYNTKLSALFGITNGVKQGCVLTPTFFLLFLWAILKEVTKDLDDTGILLRFHTDGGLFKLSHLKAKTKVMTQLIWEYLYVDNSALVARSHEDRLLIADCFSAASKLYGLTISLKKTEVLYQPWPSDVDAEILIFWTPLNISLNSRIWAALYLMMLTLTKKSRPGS